MKVPTYNWKGVFSDLKEGRRKAISAQEEKKVKRAHFPGQGNVQSFATETRAIIFQFIVGVPIPIVSFCTTFTKGTGVSSPHSLTKSKDYEWMNSETPLSSHIYMYIYICISGLKNNE